MPQPHPAPADSPTRLETAFAALARYDRGSPRGQLVPLDQAVRHALTRPAERKSLEERLIGVIDGAAPVAAKEYVCRQLTLLGSAACVPALARWLDDAVLAEPARATLEALPCPEAGAALRDAIGRLNGKALAGVVTSLGARGDRSAVGLIQPLLGHRDPAVAEAAIVALGRIGGAEARAALRTHQAAAPDGRKALLADALEEANRPSPRSRWR